jgi:hypothetical protein
MRIKTNLHSKFLRFTIAASLGLIMTAGMWMIPITKASALSSSNFNAGEIIDNGVFTNTSTMSANDIQNFLNAQLPTCDTNGTGSVSYYYNSSSGRVNNSGDTWVTTSRAVYGQRYDSWNNTSIAAAPFVCLKSYVENPNSGQNNLQNPSASISGGESAAQIIYNAAQQYSINPEVILTTIQKEQGLITDDWPWTNEYTEATGYNCSDTSGCSGYAGFFQQVDAAAKQYRNYLNNPNNFNYVVGNNTIDYAPPSDGCNSSSNVDIVNQATAALYDYTPYQPDSNVLANTNSTGSSNGPGGAVAGDSCAAYGNRNFWWYFNTWFGSSVGTYSWYASGYTVLTQNGNTAVDPGQLQPGQTYLVDIAATNTGSATWYNSGPTPVRLGTDNSPGHNSFLCDPSWLWCGRPVNLTQSSLAPGQTGNFYFYIQAPYQPGSYREYFKPVVEDYTWFNSLSVAQESLGIVVQNPGTYSWYANGYAVLDASGDERVDPGNLQPNTQYLVDIAATNTGSATWYNSGPTPVRLGTDNSPGHNSFLCDPSWLWCGRPVNLTQSSLAPGQTGNFYFYIDTPSTPGSYREYFKPLAEEYEWMNSLSIAQESLGIVVK